MGCHFLLQVIFPTQGSNPGFPHCRQTLYPLSHQGNRVIIYSCIHQSWCTWLAITKCHRYPDITYLDSHRLGNLKKRHSFFTAMEGRDLRSGCWKGWFRVRAFFLALCPPMAFPLCALRESASSLDLFLF